MIIITRVQLFLFVGGAGNALGTLYAFQNAAKLATSRYGIDISSQLKAGSISIGLYHTAGKGTRLAPLPGAENNNKVTRVFDVSVWLSFLSCRLHPYSLYIYSLNHLSH